MVLHLVPPNFHWAEGCLIEVKLRLLVAKIVCRLLRKMHRWSTPLTGINQKALNRREEISSHLLGNHCVTNIVVDWNIQDRIIYFYCLLSRAIGQPYCEVQQQLRPSAVLASIEDLSLSIDSQHTHLDITSQLGTQVWCDLYFLSFSLSHFCTSLSLTFAESSSSSLNFIFRALFTELETHVAFFVRFVTKNN